MKCLLLVLLLACQLFAILAYCTNNTRPHEHYECGSACQTECNTLGDVCPIVNIRCNDGYYCNDGYARDCNKNCKCVPISQCPPKCSCRRSCRFMSDYE